MVKVAKVSVRIPDELGIVSGQSNRFVIQAYRIFVLAAAAGDCRRVEC